MPDGATRGRFIGFAVLLAVSVLFLRCAVVGGLADVIAAFVAPALLEAKQP